MTFSGTEQSKPLQLPTDVNGRMRNGVYSFIDPQHGEHAPTFLASLQRGEHAPTYLASPVLVGLLSALSAPACHKIPVRGPACLSKPACLPALISLPALASLPW